MVELDGIGEGAGTTTGILLFVEIWQFSDEEVLSLSYVRDLPKG